MPESRMPLWVLLLASGVALCQAQAPDAQQVREAIGRLGEANGQALACGLTAPAATARSLMLKHAPRTIEYGALYEQATQTGFAAQLAGKSACPSAAEMAVRLEIIAAGLRELLPVEGG